MNYATYMQTPFSSEKEAELFYSRGGRPQHLGVSQRREMLEAEEVTGQVPACRYSTSTQG
jgi:hypothetical protein